VFARINTQVLMQASRGRGPLRLHVGRSARAEGCV